MANWLPINNSYGYSSSSTIGSNFNTISNVQFYPQQWAGSSAGGAAIQIVGQSVPPTPSPAAVDDDPVVWLRRRVSEVCELVAA